MVIIGAVLGNVNDPSWKARAAAAHVDTLQLDQWEAQKNRFRKRTQEGADLAISLERNMFLRDGDVLSWDEGPRRMVVARIALRDVMVIHLEALAQKDQGVLVRTCVELGHALGNQHWPAVVKGDQVYIPLTVDRKVMSSVMQTHAFRDVTFEFVAGSEVIPYLAPHEARRLFGGAELQTHTHVGASASAPVAHDHGEHGHSHQPGAPHDHDHAVKNGHGHHH